MKGVEGMEEFLLGPVLPCDELDVVDQETVDFPVFFPEFRRSVVPDGADELVDELLRRHVNDVHVRVKIHGEQADGVEQMRLSQADVAVYEKRVVVLRGQFPDGNSGCMGELVARADDEPLETVARIQG